MPAFMMPPQLMALLAQGGQQGLKMPGAFAVGSAMHPLLAQFMKEPGRIGQGALGGGLLINSLLNGGF